MDRETVVLAPEGVGGLSELLVELDLLSGAVDEDQAAPVEVPPQLLRLGHEIDPVLHDAGHAEGVVSLEVHVLEAAPVDLDHGPIDAGRG